MNIQLLQTYVGSNKFLRLGIGLSMVLVVLYLINFRVLINYPFYIFMAFVGPHILYYIIYYMLFLKACKRCGVGILLIVVLLLNTEFWMIKWYYYVALPHIGIVFFNNWSAGDEWTLLPKIIKANLAIALMIGLDYFYWEKYRVGIRLKALENRIKEINNNQLLSGHFLRRLYELTRNNQLKLSIRSLDFFQYVTNRIYSSKTRVALEEEWRYLCILTELCTDRRFMITGHKCVSPSVWNRSIPSLAIMTWIENAIEYSPDNVEQPIFISWSLEPEGTQLQIKNSIDEGNLTQGAGQGLKLVNRLFDPFLATAAHLSYTTEDDRFFIVTLIFKNYSRA